MKHDLVLCWAHYILLCFAMLEERHLLHTKTMFVIVDSSFFTPPV